MNIWLVLLQWALNSDIKHISRGCYSIFTLKQMMIWNASYMYIYCCGIAAECCQWNSSWHDHILQEHFFTFRYTVHYTLPYVFSLCEEIVCDTNVTSCCLHVFGVYTLGNLLFSQPDLSNLNIGKTIRVNSKGIAGF